MNAIPEIAGLSARTSLIRIPSETDVPITPRVKKIIDAPEFYRLSQVMQLGLVPLVYPAARHTRFEHSLGVYRLALLYVQRLAADPRFRLIVSEPMAELFIVTALIHDLGHYPYCHLIEDMDLPGVIPHEHRIGKRIERSELADILRQDWGVEPQNVENLLNGNTNDLPTRLLESMISGPIDIDKMDYLYRDSLHAGVPYGRHFDRQRLIGSLCLNESGDRIAITDKGRTAAELMVFARYVMFSEVYWHHTVRAATAMLQRAVFRLWDEINLNDFEDCSDFEFQKRLIDTANSRGKKSALELLLGLFGSRRQIYKRVKEFSILEDSEIVRRISRKPFEWLVRCSEFASQLASAELSIPIRPDDIIIDAPPQAKEVQFKIDVYFPRQNQYRPLQQASPAINALATEQFDFFVKRVRVFANPNVAQDLFRLADLNRWLERAVKMTDQTF